jgi:glucan phosphorylase
MRFLIGRSLANNFSSDRTISEYAADVWDVEPCPVS